MYVFVCSSYLFFPPVFLLFVFVKRVAQPEKPERWEKVKKKKKKKQQAQVYSTVCDTMCVQKRVVQL